METYTAYITCRNCIHVWQPDIPKGTSVEAFHATAVCPNCRLPAVGSYTPPPKPDPALLAAAKAAHTVFSEYGNMYGFTANFQPQCWKAICGLEAAINKATP